MTSTTEGAATMTWVDGTDLTLEGVGWSDTPGPYDRLPARAEGVVTDIVWRLSRNSAGVSVRFVTDSPAISARWTLQSDEPVPWVMSAAAASGTDLYVRDGAQWRFLGAGEPPRPATNESALITGLDPEPREFLLNLPLYNGVEELAIGVEPGAVITPAARDERRPLCMYGTSIVQGASASRPGMCHVGVLRRRFDRPTLNLGFAGNGTMEPAMADLLAELDVAAYVVDSVPNMSAEAVEARAPHFLSTIAAARPGVPILVIGATTAQLHPQTKAIYRAADAALTSAVRKLQDGGSESISFVDAANFLGDDWDGTVDTVHPNDIGIARMADALEPSIRAALAESGG